MQFNEFVERVKSDTSFAHFRQMFLHEPLLKFVYHEKCIMGPVSETRIFHNEQTQTKGGIAHSTQVVMDDYYGVFKPFEMTGIWIPLSHGTHYSILSDLHQSPLIRQRNGVDECLFLVHPNSLNVYKDLLEQYRDQSMTLSAISLSSPRSLLIALPKDSGDFEPVMVKISLNQEAHGILRLLSERECALSVANTSIFKRRLASGERLPLDVFEDVFSFVPKQPQEYVYGISLRLVPDFLHPEKAVTTEYAVPLLAFYGQANAAFFKDVVRVNGNCVTDFLKEMFQMYIHTFVHLLLDHELSMEAHGQNLLLIFDAQFKLKRLMYRDMGGVNTPIKANDLQLPPELRNPELSYFENHEQDAANAIEHHFVWRGLFPLTKQLVKQAEYFRQADSSFDRWYSACLTMDPGTKVLSNWTDGNLKSDQHQEHMSVTSFCRYGYVESLFGDMLINYLETNKILEGDAIQRLRQNLFAPERISETVYVAPCTYKTFFDEAVKKILSTKTLQLMHKEPCVMTPTQLKRCLQMYDDLSQSVQLNPKQQQALQSLRLLARSVNTTVDLSSPVIKLTTPFCSNEPWDSLAPFEKLVGALSGQHSLEHFLTSPSMTWLAQLIQTVQSQLGGTFELTPTDTSIQVRLIGSLTMKYSIFMALISANTIPQSYLDTQDIDNDVIINVDEVMLNSLMEHAKSLTFVQQYLQKMGFDVSVGSKTCEQSLSQNDLFLTRNDLKLKKSYAMSLTVANELAKHSTELLIFPLTLKITTMNDELMTLLESFYVHPLVNLFGRDGKPKTFIPETRASGSLHESVLNINQLNLLRDFFDRLEFFSRHQNTPASALNEIQMTCATAEIYRQIDADKERLIVPGQVFEAAPYATARPVSYWSFIGLFFQQSTFNLAGFEQSMETFCKNRLIPGARLFLKETPFIERLASIQEEIYQGEAYTKWPCFKESYHVTPNCSTPKSPLPLSYYARAIAQHAITGQKATIGDSLAEHTQGLLWLNKTVNRTTYGSAADQQYYDFYTENNAYYLMDSLVSNIKASLDHPNCKDCHVRELLTLLGVAEDAMKQFKSTLGGETHFNRFQIKLFLLPLVLNCLCQQDLLQDIASLARARDPWVKSTSPNSTEYANSTSTWYQYMRDWKNTEISGINWVIGGRASTSSERRQTETFGRHTLFAGGSRADVTRTTTQQQTQSTVSYGSGG